LRRVVVALAYAGEGFFGFQRQPALPTVEGLLLKKLKECEPPEGLKHSYAGRTDRGVNALWQAVAFNASESCCLETLLSKLRAPSEGILAWGYAEGVDLLFNARRRALWRDYVFVDEPANFECQDAEEASKVLEVLPKLESHAFLYKDFKSLPERLLRRRILAARVFDVEGYYFLWVRGQSFPMHYVRRLADFLRKRKCGKAFEDHARLWIPGAAEGWRLFLTGVKYDVELSIVGRYEDFEELFSKARIGFSAVRSLFSFLSSSKELLSPFSFPQLSPAPRGPRQQPLSQKEASP